MDVQLSELQQLIAQWKERLLSTGQSEDYKCALGECVYDLQNLVYQAAYDPAFIQEYLSQMPPQEIEDYFLSQEADDELSKLEVHESVA